MRTYLLASLPSCSPEGPAPLPFEEFRRKCADSLSADDLEEVKAVCSDPPGGRSPFARQWQRTFRQWHRQNVKERRARLNEPVESPAYEEILSDSLRGDHQLAWQSGDPMQREKLLLHSLWNWLEEQRRRAPYSLDDLLGYALQLQLLERRSLWNDQKGLQQFNLHTQSFLEPVLEELRNQELSA